MRGKSVGRRRKDDSCGLFICIIAAIERKVEEKDENLSG
jgi:hypothetical protein